jgi:hypothetical protein
VQQTIGLDGAMIHLNASPDEVIAQFYKLNAKVRRGRVFTDGGEHRQRDIPFPDTHGDSKLNKTKPL